MPSLTSLNRPIVRRLRREDLPLVVRITELGVEWRFYRCRRRRFATWEQIASLSGGDKPMLSRFETDAGRWMLEALAPPAAVKIKSTTEAAEQMEPSGAAVASRGRT